MSDTGSNTMNPSPIPGAGTASYDPNDPSSFTPEPKQYPPGFLSIYMLKTEQPHAKELAELAASAVPQIGAAPQVANVNDPTSGTPQNYSTPQANAFLHPDDVVPLMPSGPTA